MSRYVVLLSFLVLAGCATNDLISHGQVHGNRYLSAEAKFFISAPAKWSPTITPPFPGVEGNIASKLVRKREIGYFARDDGKACVIIETYRLTWGGRPITPIQITSADNGPQKFTKACETILAMEQQRSKETFPVFSFQCAKLKAEDMCLIDRPCLESTKEMVSSRPGEPIVLEKVLIFVNTVAAGDSSVDTHGWRVRFTLASSKDEYRENSAAFEEIIRSMQMQ